VYERIHETGGGLVRFMDYVRHVNWHCNIHGHKSIVYGVLIYKLLVVIYQEPTNGHGH